MHRTNCLLAITLGILLLGLSPGSMAPAQAPPPKGQPGARPVLIVPINGTQRVQMTTKRRIAEVRNPRESVARVQPTTDPTAILITGLDAGATRITMVDDQGAEESLDVVVQFDVEYLRSLLQRAVPTASVLPIPSANNTVILTGTVAHAEDVDVIMRAAISIVGGPERVINAMRVGGVQQVQLDVVVARVSREKIRQMSFDFMEFGNQHVVASTPGGGFTIPTTSIGNTLPGFPPIITNSVGAPNGVPSNLFLAVFNRKQEFFGLLQALKDEDVAKIMAKPTLVTLSGRPASFLDGGEQAVPVPAGLGQVGVQFEEFGTRLNFVPIVLGNGKIHLEVEPEVSDLNPAFGTSINGTVVPGRTTQRVHTTVEMGDGETFVIGGLIQHDSTGTATKVPIVGEIPFLGAAFSRKATDDRESELIIVVTPHLVDAMACDQLPKLLPGEETRSADDFELFLEGILEAPRGSREVCPDGKYQAPYKNSPTAAVYPCGNGNGHCGGPGCAAGDPSGEIAPVVPLPAVTAKVSPSTGPAADATTKPALLPPVPSPSGTGGQ
jgi:pilus assembly protein CpaC